MNATIYNLASELRTEEKMWKCPSCGSTDISDVVYHKIVCPNCQSTHISNTLVKKAQLEQEFIELIKNSRSLITPLNELMILLNNKKKDVEKNVENQKIGSKLLNNFKIFNFIKRILFEKISIYFYFLNFNRSYFFGIFNQPNSDLGFIKGILESLQINFDSIQKEVMKNINNIHENLTKMGEEYQLITKIENNLIANKIQALLSQNEIIVSITDAIAKARSKSDTDKKTKGTLVITNFDIMFLNKNFELHLKAPIKDLDKIRKDGKGKKIYVAFLGQYHYEFLLNEKNSDDVINSIILARQLGMEAPIQVRDYEIEQFLQEEDLQLNGLSSYIESSINDLLISRKEIISSEIQHDTSISTLGTNLNSSKQFIFVLMPFREDLKEIYTKYIKIPLEKEGYEVRRADDFYNSVPILTNILESISKADIIIADLTDKNPNVFYELGRAHEKKGKYVIQICQRKDELPFDLGHIRTIFYNNDQEGRLKLQKQISKYVNTYINEFKNEKVVINPDKID